MTQLFRVFLYPPKLKLRRINLSGRLMLGLGGVAACAVFITYRARARHHGAPAVAPGPIPAEPASQPNRKDPEITPPDWAAAEAPRGFLDPESDSVPVADLAMSASSDSGTEPQEEPWMDTLRLAMETEPMHYGFDKKAWTSLMLAEYMTRAHGITVPVPRIRRALKELGYRWKGTHYVLVGDGTRESR